MIGKLQFLVWGLVEYNVTGFENVFNEETLRTMFKANLQRHRVY